MEPLDNPVWHALTGPQARFSEGSSLALRYQTDVADVRRTTRRGRGRCLGRAGRARRAGRRRSPLPARALSRATRLGESSIRMNSLQMIATETIGEPRSARSCGSARPTSPRCSRSSNGRSPDRSRDGRSSSARTSAIAVAGDDGRTRRDDRRARPSRRIHRAERGVHRRRSPQARPRDPTRPRGRGRHRSTRRDADPARARGEPHRDPCLRGARLHDPRPRSRHSSSERRADLRRRPLPERRPRPRRRASPDPGNAGRAPRTARSETRSASAATNGR